MSLSTTVGPSRLFPLEERWVLTELHQLPPVLGALLRTPHQTCQGASAQAPETLGPALVDRDLRKPGSSMHFPPRPGTWAL